MWVKREVRVERQGCDDCCEGGVRCGVAQTLLQLEILMKHSHDIGNDFMNFAIIDTTIMFSATMH